MKPSTAMSATPSSEPQGQEPILPAVLEFPEHHQEPFLRQAITELDVNSPNFKLAPVYTLYLCARLILFNLKIIIEKKIKNSL